MRTADPGMATDSPPTDPTPSRAGPSSGFRGTGNIAPKARNVSSACRSCAAAKKKCDGKSPCRTCVIKGSECTYQIEKDGRRGRKRAMERLYTYNEAYESLFEVLRSSKDQSAHELLEVIRSEKLSIDEIVQRTKAIVQRDGNRAKSSARLQDSVMSIASLVDKPPILVPASPWTTVTESDADTSHLVSIYFTWHHFAYPCFDQQLFIESMCSKDSTSRYCSPFLVNCVLAVACMYTDHPIAFADPDDPSTRAEHFQEEAARLWQLENGRPSLTNLQALPQLISCLVNSGKDRLGFLHAGFCSQLMVDVVKRISKDLKQGVEEVLVDDFQRSYRLCLWGAFSVLAEVALAWMRPLDVRIPHLKLTNIDARIAEAAQWYPYPIEEPTVFYYPTVIENHRFKLYEIASALLPMVLSGNPNDSPLLGCSQLSGQTQLSLLEDVELKLFEWHQNLPPQANNDMIDSAAPIIPLIDLHLAYQGFQVTLQSLFRRRLVEVESNADQRPAEDKIMDACRNLARLLELVRSSLTFAYFSLYHSHASSLCAYNALELLAQPEARDIFHVAIVSLAAASRRWILCFGVLKMLWITIQERKLESLVHETTLDLLRSNAVDKWAAGDHHKFVDCSYPNYALVSTAPRYTTGMGDLLSQYAEKQ